MNIKELFPKPKKPRNKTIHEEIEQDFSKFCKPLPIIQEQEIEIKDEFAESLLNEFSLYEHGRIVKGSNTTDDVGVDEIKIQSKKMGFEVTKDGVPPLLNTTGKSYKPVVVENTRHLIPDFKYKEEYFIDSSGAFDVGKLYESYAYHYHKKFKIQLNEHSEEFINIINSIKSDEPVIGNEYYVLVLISLMPGHIILDGTYSPVTLTNKDLNTYNVKFSNGNTENYPKEKDGSLSAVTHLFNTLDDLNQVETYINLKFKGNIQNTIKEDKINEEVVTEINMGPKNLQKQIDKIYEKVTPIIGFEMEVCKEPAAEKIKKQS